jgi:hypothetical protein
MAIQRQSRVVSFDADAGVAAALEAGEAYVCICAEYDIDE